MDELLLRQMPHSTEAEQAVLGCADLQDKPREARRQAPRSDRRAVTPVCQWGMIPLYWRNARAFRIRSGGSGDFFCRRES